MSSDLATLLSAEICLPQTPSVRRKHTPLHIFYKISRSRKVLLEILTHMESV